MSNTFSYTSPAGAVTSITFDRYGHLANDSFKVSLNAKIEQSIGGTDYALEYGEAKKSFPFSFIVPRAKLSTETDMPAAMAFLILVSATKTFTWTDENGVARIVRQMSLDFQFTPLEGKWMKCEIELKEQ